MRSSPNNGHIQVSVCPSFVVSCPSFVVPYERWYVIAMKCSTSPRSLNISLLRCFCGGLATHRTSLWLKQRMLAKARIARVAPWESTFVQNMTVNSANLRAVAVVPLG